MTPRFNSHERVKRSLALRYEGLSQQAKFVQSIGQSTEIVNKRIEKNELIAEGLGFSKLRNKKDERTGIGQVMPSVTEIIRETLDESSHTIVCILQWHIPIFGHIANSATGKLTK